MILHNEMCQHLEDLHNLGNHCFPKEEYTHIPKLCKVRNPIKVQDRPTDSNVTVQRTHQYSFRHHLATLGNYHLSSAGIVSKKNIQILKDY